MVRLTSWYVKLRPSLLGCPNKNVFTDTQRRSIRGWNLPKTSIQGWQARETEYAHDPGQLIWTPI